MCITKEEINELQEGDIVEFSSKVPDNRLILPGLEVPIVKHYGIILIQNGEKKIGHNTFQQYPQIDDIEKTLNCRTINRIIRTGIKSEELISNHNKVAYKKYDFLCYNCEDYIFQVTGVRVGLDQRIIFGTILLIIILVIIIIIYRSYNK